MNKVVIITGAAQRLGAAMARHFHEHQYNVVIHYNHSLAEAERLANDLNKIRHDSAVMAQGDLLEADVYADIINTAIDHWERVDVLINNASIFHYTPFSKASVADWDLMLTANLKACYFLSQKAAPYLQESKGCIINISDIFAEVPKYEYSIYSLTKAALNSLTKSLAQELAPQVRVNAIAPGDILPPNTNRVVKDSNKKRLLDYKPCANDIAQAAYFAATSQYITGQILTIDGGKTISKG